jgi:hypothetical protein
MKRIVIAINNSWMVNQFGLNELSGVLNANGEEVEYLIHRHPLMKIKKGDELQTNFDILIDSTSDNERTPLAQLLPAHRRFSNVRDTKSIGRFKINQAGKDEKGFIKIGAWTTNDDILNGSSGQFGNDFGGKVVLKDEFGARGIGQVLFDVVQISPSDVLNTLTKLRKEVLGSVINDVPAKDELSDEDILKLIHQRLPGVKFGYDLKAGVRESLNAITTNKLYLEEYIPDITAEYRILFAPGEQYVFRRVIEDVDGYPQACGSTGGMKDPLSGSGLSKIAHEFEGALRTLNKAGILYGSADLFVTKNGWGLFEYSSQFAANGVNPLYSAGVQEALIQHVIGRYLEEES